MNKSFIKREVKKMEKEIIFVTHNTGKIKSAEKYFKISADLEIGNVYNNIAFFYAKYNKINIKRQRLK